jgi:hypothetical protein
MFPYFCSSYKEVLRLSINEGRKRGLRKTFQAMANHCRIQKTYLSKVINHDAHLNADQLYLAMDYVGLNEEAQEFVLLLAELEKTQIPQRRAILEIQVKHRQDDKLKTEAHLDVRPESMPIEQMAEYFLDPLMQVIHMHLTIKKFALSPAKIAESLPIDIHALNRRLMALEQMGIIAFRGNRDPATRVDLLRDNLHLPQNSFLQNSYASRMRLKAVERMEGLAEDQAYRFSVVFSASSKTKKQIHASFLNWLKETQAAVKSSREESVYQMNFDLFSWTPE